MKSHVPMVSRRIGVFAGLCLVISVLLLASTISPEESASSASDIESARSRNRPVLEEFSDDSELAAFLPIILNNCRYVRCTQVTVDGKSDDWADRTILHVDPTGDTEEGYLDFANGFAFVNAHALYILVETVDSEAPFVLFDMSFQADNRSLQITWKPGQDSIDITEWQNGNPLTSEPALNSYVAFDTALEARLDLDDFEQPDNVRIDSIKVMIGGDADWRAADAWTPTTAPPVVDEVDPARVHSEAERYALARRFELPEPYLAERLFSPPAADLNGIAHSETGVVFIQHWYGLDAGISRLDPATGTVTRLLDIPPTVGFGWVTSGPGDTIFVGAGGEVRQVKPDGSYTIWGTSEWAFPRYHTPDGRLIGISHDATRIVELHPDGTETNIATGLSQVFDVVANSDGTLFYNSLADGNLTRIDPDGTQHLLVSGLWYHSLEIGPDGHLYAVGNSFDRVDEATGARTTYPMRYGDCHGFHGVDDFIFTDPGEVLFIDPTLSQVGWLDLNLGASGILVSNEGANSPAADIGPDDALYYGEWGCTPEDRAQVVRLGNDGLREVVVSDLHGFFWDMAFAPDGGLFFAVDRGGGDNQLYYLGPQAQSPVQVPGLPGGQIMSLSVDPSSGYLMVTEGRQPTIKGFSTGGQVLTHTVDLPPDFLEFRLDYTPDGTAYAYVADDGLVTPGHFDRRVMLLDIAAGTSETVADFSKDAPYSEGGIGKLHTDLQDIWLLIDPEMQIHRILVDGSATLFANNLPIDPMAVVTDSSGDVYFTSSSGIFRIYPEAECGCASASEKRRE